MSLLNCTNTFLILILYFVNKCTIIAMKINKKNVDEVKKLYYAEL